MLPAGDERALTGTLPRPWKATVSNDKVVIAQDESDSTEITHEVVVVGPQKTVEKTATV